MSIYDSLNGTNQQQVLSQLKNDPQGMLAKAGFNIPNGLNNPQQIINHLMQTGQVSSPRLQMAQRMAGMFRR